MDRLLAHFIRHHQSFIVTKNFVTPFNPKTEVLNMLDEALPISRSFKKRVLEGLLLFSRIFHKIPLIYFKGIFKKPFVCILPHLSLFYDSYNDSYLKAHDT